MELGKDRDLVSSLKKVYADALRKAEPSAANKDTLDRLLGDALSDNLDKARISAAAIKHFFSVSLIYSIACEANTGELRKEGFISSYKEIVELDEVYGSIVLNQSHEGVHRMLINELGVWANLNGSGNFTKALSVPKEEVNAEILKALKSASPAEYYRAFIFGRKYALGIDETVNKIIEAADAAVIDGITASSLEKESGIKRAISGFKMAAERIDELVGERMLLAKMVGEYLYRLDIEAPYATCALFKESLKGTGIAPSDPAIASLSAMLDALEKESGDVVDSIFRALERRTEDAYIDMGAKSEAFLGGAVTAFEALDGAKRVVLARLLRK